MKNKIFISAFVVSLCVPLFANANIGELNGKLINNIPNLSVKANIDARLGNHSEDNDNRGGANVGMGASISAEHRNNDNNNSRATSTGNKDKDKNESDDKTENKGWFGGWLNGWFGHWFNWGHASSTPEVVIKINQNMTTVATSTAEINWSTNAFTTAEIRYATSADAVKTSASIASDTNLSLNHKIVLTNLSAGTKYYFQITAKDSLGNTKQSGIANFTTKTDAIVDTTAPNILFSTVLSVGTNDARILWVTNEPSNSKVWVSESDTVSTTGTENAGHLNLGYVHDVNVVSLKSGTKYFYKVGSTDASNNVTISAVGSFTTK